MIAAGFVSEPSGILGGFRPSRAKKNYFIEHCLLCRAKMLYCGYEAIGRRFKKTKKTPRATWKK